MRFTVLVLLGLVTLASAWCGAVLHENIHALHATYQSYEEATAGQLTRRNELNQTVTVYFHVITSDKTVAGGNVSKAVIDRQMKILNNAYKPTGLSFAIKDIIYSQAREWRYMRMESAMEYDMMRTLRQGKYSDLNIYSNSIARSGGNRVLGYAYSPKAASNRTERDFNLDGVIVDPVSMPGFSKEYPNIKGYTLIHEVGHWLGLLHTFEGSTEADPKGGCKGYGDHIFDTPAEASPSTKCEKGRDSCKGKVEDENPTSMPGPDPIHNYMNYSPDTCQTEFTPGQIRRMMTVYANTRQEQGEHDAGTRRDRL